MAFDMGRLMEEMAEAGRTIDGIDRVFGYPPDKIEPPALIVAWPEEIAYDETYGGTQHDYMFPVFLVLGLGGVSRIRRDKVAQWLSRDVKDALDNRKFNYTDDPIVVVTTAETEILTLGGMDYLSVKFTTEVTSTT